MLLSNFYLCDYGVKTIGGFDTDSWKKQLFDTKIIGEPIEKRVLEEIHAKTTEINSGFLCFSISDLKILVSKNNHSTMVYIYSKDEKDFQEVIYRKLHKFNQGYIKRINFLYELQRMGPLVKKYLPRFKYLIFIDMLYGEINKFINNSDTITKEDFISKCINGNWNETMILFTDIKKSVFTRKRKGVYYMKS